MKTLIGVLTTATLAAFGVAAPAVAAPQGPWVLPASDISVPGQTASKPQITTGPGRHHDRGLAPLQRLQHRHPGRDPPPGGASVPR